MSENETQAPAANVAQPANAKQPLFSVTRNGVSLPLYATKFSRAGEDMKGVEFPSFGNKSVIVKNLDNVIKFFGADWIASCIASKARALASGTWEENCADLVDAQGHPLKVKGETQADWSKPNREGFIKDIQELSARGENIAELKKQLAELIEQLTALDATAEDFMTSVMGLQKEIADVNRAIASKKRNTETKVEANDVPATTAAQ